MLNSFQRHATDLLRRVGIVVLDCLFKTLFTVGIDAEDDIALLHLDADLRMDVNARFLGRGTTSNLGNAVDRRVLNSRDMARGRGLHFCDIWTNFYVFRLDIWIATLCFDDSLECLVSLAGLQDIDGEFRALPFRCFTCHLEQDTSKLA